MLIFESVRLHSRYEDRAMTCPCGDSITLWAMNECRRQDMPARCSGCVVATMQFRAEESEQERSTGRLTLREVVRRVSEARG